jgi:hypothetical protein
MWIFMLFAGVGIALLVAGGYWTVGVRQFLATAVEVPGRIVDVSSYTDDDGQRMHQAVIAFTAQDGSDHEFVSSASTSWSPKVGSQVKVLYDPAAPGDARQSGFWNIWLGPVIVLGIGGALLIAGIGLWLLLRGKPLQESDSTVDFMLDD